MLGDHVHVVGTMLEHAARPAALAAVAQIAGADEHQVGIRFTHCASDQVVLQHVLVELHETELPPTPHLVADTPVFDGERFSVSILDSPRAADRVDRAVAVVDLLSGGIVIAESGVGGDHRLGVDLTTKVDEFVDADVVMLDSGPSGIVTGRAAIAVADAVAPIVAADEVATRPAIHRER